MVKSRPPLDPASIWQHMEQRLEGVQRVETRLNYLVSILVNPSCSSLLPVSQSQTAVEGQTSSGHAPPPPKGTSRRLRKIPPSSSLISIVEGILERVKDKPKVSSDERQALEDLVAHRDRKTTRLTPSDLECIARLSARQMNRLNKRRLMSEDREIIQAMEMLKRASGK